MPRSKSPENSVPSKKTRKLRSRPKPKWLSTNSNIDPVAQRRCLMILSVLSGERPVTEVIAEAGITRGLYYQLETRALNAILQAMMSSSDSSPEGTSWSARLKSLEDKLSRAEQGKRRAEKMLNLTRKLLRPGPMKRPRGKAVKTSKNPKKHGPKAKKTGSSPVTKMNGTKTTMTPAKENSIPTKDGGTES